MARHKSTLTLDFLTTFLPDFLIEKYARALGVVERDRKVDPVLLVWTLILGFPAGAKRTLAELLKMLVDWRLSIGREDGNAGLAGFKELLALDSTVVQLHKMLAPRWQSTDPDGAAAKLHMVTNVVSGSPNRVLDRSAVFARENASRVRRRGSLGCSSASAHSPNSRSTPRYHTVLQVDDT